MFIVLGYNHALDAAAIGTKSARPFSSAAAAERARTRLEQAAADSGVHVSFLVLEVTSEAAAL